MDTTTLLLNNGWKFYYGDEPNAWQKGFCDNSWQDICLPHDWSVQIPFSREYSSGTGYAAGGIGWYRLHFHLPEAYRGKRVRIIFDGIYKNSRVWCNSYYLGYYPNGYTTFSYDITDQVHFGEEENLVSVRVDRTEIADSRWFTGSGITRKVTLLVEEPLHLALNGMFFSTPEVSKECAAVRFENEVVNDSDQEQTITVTNTLYQEDRTPVGRYTGTLTVPPRSSSTVICEGTLSNPHLWSPEHPYLYTAIASFTSKQETSYQTACCRVGIRTFFFDPDRGFFLNGVSVKLKGVCLHHDAGALGAAVTRPVWERRLQKLKAMGCNAIRCSHNPHMPELYDLCDEMGFLMMDEAFDEWEGPKNKWSTGHNVYPPKHEGYYIHFPEWHNKDLTAMIRRDRNHPSVILWSIGNEIDYPNDPYCHPSFATMTGNNDANKPAAERVYSPDRPNAERLAVLARMLTEEVKRVDTTHPVTLAAAFPELSSRIGFLDSLDVAGYNYKEHLYEESHQRFPNLPFLGSENGHGYDAWRAVTDHDYISGQFLWTGIDYLGEAQGWPVRASGAGLLTLAGFEKPGYYRRMSFWSDRPMARLATARVEDDRQWKSYQETWNYTPGEEVEVLCYTNLPEAELFLNHGSLGKKLRDQNEECIRWTLPFAPGSLEVTASDPSCGKTASHTLETVYAPCRIQLKEWKSSFTEAVPDIAQVEVSVLDQNGRLAAADSSLLHVSVTGGTLLGIENGDIGDCTDYTSSSRRVYQGRMLLFLCPLADVMVVTVSGEPLTPAILRIGKD
ncbi:MAG: glycoside hydrolase family 2 TIM barrel-domain containing protein [Lachnospiraceae bacterium]|nr:glycoside hydrolase family 2 TIM barrel-domain containing protein [Lachnospiraceae bacterium]